MSTTEIDESEEGVLKRFMEEFFDFDALKKAGFYPKGMKRKDYKTQAERICYYFGFKTVYEWGAKEVGPYNLSYADGHRPPGEPFVNIAPSIYD